MKIKWIDDSQGVPLEELRKFRQETEDVKENKLKSLIVVILHSQPVRYRRDDCSEVVQESRVFRVEGLAEHRH